MPKHKIFPSKTLLSHPFEKFLFRNLRPTFEVMGAHYQHLANTGELAKRWSEPKNALTTRKRKPNQSNFSEEEIYHLAVYDYTSNIINACETLEDIRTYLSSFPKTRIFYEHNITEDKWIHYHYSNYLITVVGIFDTALILTNAVFMLGLEPKQCNRDTIIGNYWVRRTEVKSALQDLDRTVDPYRYHRNLYVHRSETPRLEILDALVAINTVRRNGTPIIDTKTVNSLFQLVRRDITQALDKELAQLEASLIAFFDALQISYSKGMNNDISARNRN